MATVTVALGLLTARARQGWRVCLVYINLSWNWEEAKREIFLWYVSNFCHIAQPSNPPCDTDCLSGWISPISRFNLHFRDVRDAFIHAWYINIITWRAGTAYLSWAEHGFFRSSDGWISCCNASFYYLPDTCHLAFIQLLADCARHTVDSCTCLFTIKTTNNSIQY